MVQDVFTIHIDVPPEFKTGKFERYVRPAINAVLDAGKNAIMEKLRYALGKGGRFNVGATGTAARNFIAKRYNPRGDQPYVVIREGEKTPANFFIRTGSVGRGNPPPLNNIRVWATAKQIRFLDPELYRARQEGHILPKVLSPEQQVRYISPKQKRKMRPWKRSKSLFERVIEKIMWSIAYFGTSKWSVRRPPVGKRYFDYPWWVMSQKHDWMKVLDEGAGFIARAFVNFALSGEEAKFIQELARYRTFTYPAYEV